MMEPTYRELTELADGTLEPERRREVEALVAGSERLQREMALLTALNGRVRRTTESATAPFTAKVMRSVVPSSSESFWFRFFRTTANVAALAAVVAVVGYVFSSSSGAPALAHTPAANAFDALTDIYAAGKGAWTEWVRKAMLPVGSAVNSGAGRSMLVGIFIYLFYAAMDGLWNRRMTPRK